MVKNNYRILSINPGSTSTKIGVFDNEECVFKVNILHSNTELSQFSDISSQREFRLNTVLKSLEENNIDITSIDAFSGRGGSLECLKGGTYLINGLMYTDAKEMKIVKHPSALGIVIAYELGKKYGKPSFCVNPPDVDEFILEARITGIPNIYRESRIHALNQKEIAIRYAKKIKKKYEDLNLIICHAGGGISVAAHNHGKMIDCNDIINGDGPMAPNRSGALPAKALINLCFSKKYSEEEIKALVSKNGGLLAHLGTDDIKEIDRRIENNDKKAKIIYDSMIYQIAKQIGAMYASLKGNCTAIILTGGISNDEYFVKKLSKYVKKIAKVVVMPGEFELEALSSGALRVLTNEEKALSYTGVKVFNGLESII